MKNYPNSTTVTIESAKAEITSLKKALKANTAEQKASDPTKKRQLKAKQTRILNIIKDLRKDILQLRLPDFRLLPRNGIGWQTALQPQDQRFQSPALTRAPAAQSGYTSSRFLNLPYDIRLIIYKEIFNLYGRKIISIRPTAREASLPAEKPDQWLMSICGETRADPRGPVQPFVFYPALLPILQAHRVFSLEAKPIWFGSNAHRFSDFGMSKHQITNFDIGDLKMQMLEEVRLYYTCENKVEIFRVLRGLKNVKKLTVVFTRKAFEANHVVANRTWPALKKVEFKLVGGPLRQKYHYRGVDWTRQPMIPNCTKNSDEIRAHVDGRMLTEGRKYGLQWDFHETFPAVRKQWEEFFCC